MEERQLIITVHEMRNLPPMQDRYDTKGLPPSKRGIVLTCTAFGHELQTTRKATWKVGSSESEV